MTTAAITGTYVLHEHVFDVKSVQETAFRGRRRVNARLPAAPAPLPGAAAAVV
jgi:hypothetical protein